MSRGRMGPFPCVAALLLVLSVGDAFAQGTAATPPALPRFDVSAGLGWFSASPERGHDSWYTDAAWFGGEAGYYVTEHVKLEAGGSFAAGGTSWSYEAGVDGSNPPLSYISSQHEHQVSSFSAGLTYQFRSNAWVHPYMGGGVDIDRERTHTTSWVQPAYDPRGNFPQPYEIQEVTTRLAGRAFAVGGVKVFFSERAFMRADLKVAGWSGFDKVIPRVLFGADF